MADKTIVKSKSGATSRSKALDYSLIPHEAIEAIINRFQYGIEHGHARNNWKIGKDDAEFIRERLNHATKHLLRVQDGTGNYKDLEAVMCNLSMLCWWYRNGNGTKSALPHLYEQ